MDLSPQNSTVTPQVSCERPLEDIQHVLAYFFGNFMGKIVQTKTNKYVKPREKKLKRFYKLPNLLPYLQPTQRLPGALNEAK